MSWAYISWAYILLGLRMPSPSTELCPATIKIEPSNLRDSTHFLQKLPKKEPPPGRGGFLFAIGFGDLVALNKSWMSGPTMSKNSRPAFSSERWNVGVHRIMRIHNAKTSWGERGRFNKVTHIWIQSCWSAGQTCSHPECFLIWLNDFRTCLVYIYIIYVYICIWMVKTWDPDPGTLQTTQLEEKPV